MLFRSVANLCLHADSSAYKAMAVSEASRVTRVSTDQSAADHLSSRDGASRIGYEDQFRRRRRAFRAPLRSGFGSESSTFGTERYWQGSWFAVSGGTLSVPPSSCGADEFCKMLQTVILTPTEWTAANGFLTAGQSCSPQLENLS